MKFEKMHAAGNDYIYVNLFEEQVENPEELSRRLSDRHFGVGSDGLVLIGPSTEGDFSMQMYNADGSEGLMCGNAARCVGKFLYERGWTTRKEIALHTKSGIKQLQLSVNRQTDIVESIRVNMGSAILSADSAGSTGIFQSALNKMIDYPVQFDEQKYRITFVSMGNPHAVIFMNVLMSWRLKRSAQDRTSRPVPGAHECGIYRSDRFHAFENAGMGAGQWRAMACGSGACAAVVAGVITGRSKPKASVT